MGERKGQNKYYPPDYDPKAGGLNKFLGTHALRERARKLHMGILIIRFEMPFNIWCNECENHIGMGVRYNAEKKKIGMYYSTPVYQFRMKCHLCNNHFEIKTDPGNLDYVIVSGARRQENRWDPLENEQIVPETKEVSRRLYDDAMYKLEHGVEDKNISKSRKNALDRAIALNETVWKDDYAANCHLRSVFRAKKKEIQQSASMDQAFLNKMNINIPLVKEHDHDIKLAKLLATNKQKNAKNKSLPLKRLAAIAKLKHSSRSTLTKRSKKLCLPAIIPSPSTSIPETKCTPLQLVNYDSSESDT